MMKSLILATLTAGLGSVATSTLAAPTNTWYGGVGFGITKMDDDVLTTNVSDDDLGWKLFGGYHLYNNLAIEGAWAALGEHKALTAQVKTSGFAIEAVGTVPLQDYLDIFGKLGGFMWSSDMTNTIASPTSKDDSGFDLTLGLGARWQLPKDMVQNLALRGEWEYFKAAQEIHMYSLGVEFQFQ